MFTIHSTGDWRPGQIVATWTPGTRRIVPEVERQIDLAWAQASSRLTGKLFDGPMCRLEHCSASPAELRLSLSRTSYRSFLGTNLTNARLADEFGREVLANPVGLSTALETSDGWLLLGRRNDSVAYYPNRIHPFAGALEPCEPMDVFAEVRRELREELALEAEDIADIRCIGLVEDTSLRQPELIFHVRSPLTRSQIESNLNHTEHEAVYAVQTSRIIDQPSDDPLFTPVAAASLELWKRSR